MMTRTLGLLCFILSLELGFSQTICPTGRWGDSCTDVCNSNCFRNCHRYTGTCTDACIVGKYDSFCDKDCECTFGCDKETGHCECDLYGCVTCGATDNGVCNECDSSRNYVPSSTDPYKCCSEGCKRLDSNGVLDCNAAGDCVLDGCIYGYWGTKCTKCTETIEHCEICDLLQNSDVLICTLCQPGYELSVDQRRCCLSGCDDCAGDICSVCKAGYYIYGEICDTCGDFCQPPGNGSARCDPVTGMCNYGCLEGWHGSQCNVQCLLAKCETCDYNDPLLTCHTCSDGYAPSLTTGFCETCSANCINGRCDNTTGNCIEGCLPGWRSDRCDESCDDAGLSKCSVCGRYGLTCSECTFDFWGSICEEACSEHCVPIANSHVCDKATAACTLGCLPGYWRADCNEECPNCLNDTCIIDNGVCQSGACAAGFWGADCMNTCDLACASNPSTGALECNFGSGFCTHGCKYNFFGDKCERTCNGQCLDNRTTTVSIFDEEPLCEQSSGVCKFGCNNGYYSEDCSATCTSTCVTGTCDRDKGYCLACDEPKDWLCYSGKCDAGSYGSYCNITCPGRDNCLDSLCHRYTSVCEGCITNFWDDSCQNNCSTCIGGLCNQDTGICDIACTDGYFGTQCQDKCIDKCDVCSRQDGSCIRCSAGTYGPVCELNCSANCALTDGALLCDKGTGACSSGECLPGYYGLSCSLKCYNNCLPIANVVTCEYDTGFCTDGCKRGWYGSLCTGECSLNCRNKNCFGDSNICLDGCADDYYGYLCLEPCSSGCYLGICYDDGNCTAGCIQERFGDTCTQTCSDTCIDNYCDRHSGNCAECTKLDPDILCRTASCDPGYYGIRCNVACPSTNCLDNRCKRYDGDCDGCITRRYGNVCDELCNTCSKGNCTQSSGKCLEGCNDGWFGEMCEYPCDACVTCRQSSGICTECRAEKYGSSCEHNCSSNCQPTMTGFKSCDVNTAACASLACLPGYYGADCFTPCHTNCGPNNNDEVLCDFVTGACLADCKPLFYGQNCELACESNCHDRTCHRERGICSDCELVIKPPNCPGALCNTTFYGQNCTLPCPRGCEKACERYTAKCANCKPGLQGDKCDQSCTYPGCYKCVQSTGTCESCKAGKYGINCDKDCGNCLPIDGEIRCDMMTGDCLSDVCQAGRWGSDCTSKCNKNCGNENGKDICDKFTGICTLGCDLSTFGDFCAGNCSTTCKNSNCKDSASNCQEGCAPGYYGLNACQTPCSINCINRNCKENDGFCIDGCNDGFYKDQCSKACESTCINDRCDRTTGHCPECTQDTANPYYFCRGAECTAGLQGQTCNTPCPANCKEECERYSGKCKGCGLGFWDDYCIENCTNCLQGLCNQNTGVCDLECKPGYFDPYCETPCIYTGCKTCVRQSGLCISCKDELYGEACERSCSLHCTPQEDDLHLCDKDTGTCQEGSCLPGSWSLDCYQSCNMNCKADAFGDRTCYYQTGNCSNGCEDRFWDDQCDKHCSHQCLYDMCKRDATCLVGCVAGKYGNACEWDCLDTCNDDTCDRYSGICEECNKPFEQQTKLCRTAECPPGRTGLLCDEPCHSNCFERCERYDNSTCVGCINGFYGDLCVDQCGECVNDSCSQFTGICDRGCLDEWYGEQCKTQCPDDNCRTCDITTGTCQQCKPTYYGITCEQMCSSFCKPNSDGYIRCERTTGVCSETMCQDGYFLEGCTKSCNDNCAKDSNDIGPCDIITGKCAYGCESGWYGDTCDRQCSENCVDVVCNRTGHCITGCKTGFYGGDCRLTCTQSLTCNDGTCHRYNGNCFECDKPDPTPVCRTADCAVGAYGLFCNMTCPTNCEGGVCIRETGLCQACNPTWYGDDCTSRCLNCEDDICFQSTGHCIRGCKDGFYTNKCNEPCLHEGCQDCTRNNGTCITCKVAKYNKNCSEDCSTRCEATDQGLRTCSKASGICDANACLAGYWSETCREECSPYCDTDDCELTSGSCTPCKVGYYGLQCGSPCSARCKKSNCSGAQDNCLEGCADGFWFATCEKDCNSNCVQKICNINTGTCTLGCEGDKFYGPTCKEPCNDNCNGAVCERDGYCRHGCKKGTYGLMCENTCPDEARCTDQTCDRNAGSCSECDAEDPGPLCPSAACPSGKRGGNCTEDCTSTACLYNRCTRNTDICIGCPIGMTGILCDNACGGCKVGTGCNQLNEVCDEGCRDGYHGEKCEQECSAACQSCERDPPAQCVVCTDNRWGPGCLKTCIANCAKTMVGSLEYTRCDKDTGYCSEGACVNHRYWNEDCSQLCPPNCLVDTNGYKTCRISDGACSNGCVATFYGPQCIEKCSVQCKDQLCVNSPNNCINGCSDGFFNLPTCSGTCSSWCKNPGKCNSVTGSCIGGCAAGYFGDRCIEQCYGKCTDGTCDDQGGCPDCRISPVGPLCYPQVCQALKYGPSCESDCPGLYCTDDACHRQTGKCPQGCKDWFHGEYCTEKCICYLTGTEACDQSGICECKVGWTSVDCSQACSDGCRNSECERNGQCTLGCIAGRYGSTCENSCSNCLNEACDSSTGECQSGCKAGFYGGRCDALCSDNCYACDSSGTCIQCLSSRYGLPSCSQTCSLTCKQSASARICLESNGACVDGCSPRYWGDKCTERCGFCGGDGGCSSQSGGCIAGCEPGYYTSTCTTPCSTSCATGGTHNQRECHVDTGACEHGCRTGYYGDTCEECSDHCLGKKCSSAAVCTDGCVASYYSKNTGCNLDCSRCKNGRCNDSGSCLSGCEDGFYGPHCQKVCSKTCKDDTCDQTTGECGDCSKTPSGPLCRDLDVVTVAPTDERLSMEAIIGIAAGCAGAVIIIAILMVCCVFYRRQATDAKNEIHLPSDVLERLSTHRSHHSTISSQYPVARVVGDDEKDFVLF